MKLEISKKDNLHQIYIIIGFIGGFLILYFLFLYYFYVNPSGNSISIFLIIGFSIIIIVIFYFFLDLNKNGENNVLFAFKFLSEDSIKLILMVLMSIVIFIPPVSVSKIITDWNEVGYLNYFRAIVFLIGGAYLPGACLFKIIFPKSTLHERIKIDPLILKLTLYPLISLIFLATATSIIDVLGTNKGSFSIILFFIILILFISDLLIQKFRNKTIFKSISTEIKISKYSILILIVALAIIIIAYGNHLNTEYSIFIDHYTAVSYVQFIGNSNRTKYSKFYIYNIYWAYTSFGISSLCGIPPINTDAILFPFLYLFVTSIFLLIKAILRDLKDSFAFLSSMFAVPFLGIFFIFPIGSEILWWTFCGILFFSYKSYAIFLFIISFALFIIVSNNFQMKNKRFALKIENYTIIILSSLLLIHSYMIYLIPALMGFILMFFYCLFSNNRKESFFYFLIFFSSFIAFYIFFDILFDFFFSWYNVNMFTFFTGIEKLELNSTVLISNAIRFYIFLIFICIFFYFLYFFISRISTKKVIKKDILIFAIGILIFNIFIIGYYFFFLYYFSWTPVKFLLYFMTTGKSYPKIQLFYYNILLFISISIIFLIFSMCIFLYYRTKYFRSISEKIFGKNNSKLMKTIFILVIIIYSILFLLYILNFYIFKELSFFYLYLGTILINIGIIGILGTFLSYFCYKENKRLFFMLFFWIIFTFIIASILIFRNWYLYSNVSPNRIPLILYERMIHWFTRLWYYSIIPLSILAALGLIKLIEYFKSKNSRKITNMNFNLLFKLSLVSILIIFLLSGTILDSVANNEREWYTEDDEAHIIGWISENISPDEYIITDNYDLYNLMQHFSYYTTVYFQAEATSLFENNEFPLISYDFDSDCVFYFVEYFKGYNNILGLSDYNNKGSIFFKSQFHVLRDNGSVQFMLSVSDKSKKFTIDLNVGELEGTAIRLMINSNGLYGYNESTNQKIIEVENYEWYRFKIDFECTNGGYKSLNKFKWKVNINGDDYGVYSFKNNLSSVKYLSFYSDIENWGYNIYLNDITYSWQIYLKDIIYYTHLNLMNLLKIRRFKYFINEYDKVYYDRWGRKMNSEYGLFCLEMDNYLVSNLYDDNKVYDYGDYSIFKLR